MDYDAKTATVITDGTVDEAELVDAFEGTRYSATVR